MVWIVVRNATVRFGAVALPANGDRLVDLDQHRLTSVSRIDRDVRLAPILLKKSFLVDERDFLAPLVRPKRCDVRDHMDSCKSDR